MTKAAIQTLSELNPLAAMDAKVSDGQGVEFTMLRLVPDTRPSAIYDQARPPLDDPGATGNRKSEQNDIVGRHIGSPVGQRLWRDIAVECWATSQVDDGDVF
ncbi:MAG: hypothetical protein ABGX15_17800 [Paracoccaceae bacterium]